VLVAACYGHADLRPSHTPTLAAVLEAREGSNRSARCDVTCRVDAAMASMNSSIAPGRP